LGEKLINEGAETLKKLSETIDTTRMKNPSFHDGHNGRRPLCLPETGRVFVVPIG